MRFTDSPYERMMTQVPTETREAHGPPVRPPDHPCYGNKREIISKIIVIHTFKAETDHQKSV